MSLRDHAESELKRAGLFDKDSDYGGELGKGVLELVEVFAKQGHSGCSAGMTIQLLEKLLRYQTLTPITSDPAEWQQHAADVWQSTRSPSVFSVDGGKTWYDLDDPEKKNWPKPPAREESCEG